MKTATPEILKKLQYEWPKFWARPNQLPPSDTDWLVWFLCAGRGFGKTRTGAEFVRSEVEAGRAKRVALIAPTAGDARDVMVEGESGLLAVCPPWNKPVYEPSKRRVVWPNGALATLYSADEPERLRGPQHDLAWADELGSWRYAENAWNMLMFGLRLGSYPRVAVTTTPKPTKLLRQLLKAPTTRVTTGSTFQNKNNLAPSFIKTVIEKYEGTRLGRQELHAELLEQADGALWNRDMIEAARLKDGMVLPDFKRVVVAIDPAASNTQESAETGIVVAGLGMNNRGYIIADYSGHYSPESWASKAIWAYNAHSADRIIAEVNNGGNMVEATIRAVNRSVPYRAVHASRGKAARAEPVAALYEQGKITHLCTSQALEDQLCTWEPLGDDRSPDRLDALVWAVTELMLTGKAAIIAAPFVTSRPRYIPGTGDPGAYQNPAAPKRGF